jgi:thiamine-phosphate pyrophosphorylase
MEAEEPTLVAQFFISQLIRMQNLKAQKALHGKS